MDYAITVASQVEDMANAAELTRILDKLEERVTNYIKFFKWICAFAFVWLGYISFSLYQINGEIGKLRLPQRLAQSSLAPTDAKSQSEARTILAVAKKDEIVLPDPMFSTAASHFINATNQDARAWEVVPDFLSYRSFLNALLPSPVGDAKLEKSTDQIDPDWDFTLPVDDKLPNGPLPERPSGGKLSSGVDVGFYRPAVPVEEAAAIRFLDKPAKGRFGPKFIVLEGNGTIAIRLDGFHMRNVIFRKVIVVYRGGPTKLENVLFINCRFQLEAARHGPEFARVALQPAPTSFQVSD